MSPNFTIELEFSKPVIGIDEAGRGPLAGPVVAAAVKFDQDLEKLGVNDSKKLSKKRREEIYQILIGDFEFSIGIASAREVDELNILNATKLAMSRCASSFDDAHIFIVDGRDKFPGKSEIYPVIKGDTKSITIASASIIAKVTRDKIMEEISLIYPEYGFERHAGYGTKLHLEAIAKYGITEHHRRSFRPIFDYN